MGLFKRKKMERPKSQLGYALYKYDNIVNKDLKKIIGNLTLKKKMNFKKVNIVLEDIFNRLNTILDEISKENLKVDYRSDKIRSSMIDMIQGLKNYFNKAKTYNFEPEKMENNRLYISLEKILSMREEIKKKMKDIESDYI